MTQLFWVGPSTDSKLNRWYNWVLIWVLTISVSEFYIFFFHDSFLSFFCCCCRKLIIGGEQFSPDSFKANDRSCEYKFSWITSGFKPTKRGERNDLSFVYHFQNAEVIHKVQAKLYSPENGSHIKWGTQVIKTELTVNGLDPITAGSASPLQTLFPSKVLYKWNGRKYIYSCIIIIQHSLFFCQR